MFPQNVLLTAVYLILYLLILIFCVDEANEAVRSMIFRKIEGYRVKNTFKTTSSLTEIQCCGQCLGEVGCVSANFRKDHTYLNCDLNLKSPLDADTSIQKSDNWSVFYMDNDHWKLVFRLTAGGGANPYQSWKDGVSTNDSDGCMMLYPPSCTSYYRHKLLDEWETWPVDQVKFALYENHTQVAYVIFNGTKSNKESWFSKERVLESSWSDMIGSTQMLFFSIQGHSDLGRHFFIQRSYNGCSGDIGWAMTSSGIQTGCSFDRHASYPGLVYARNGTNAIYESQGFGEADVLAVYVKFKELLTV